MDRKKLSKPVILGMVSPIPGCLHPDIPGAAGQRLFRLSGMSLAAYEQSFERINLLPTGSWDKSRARKLAPKIMKKLAGRNVVVLGAEVWRALGLGSLLRRPGSCVIFSDGSLYFFLPHPSGRNLYYNDEKNRLAAGKLLRRLS